MKSDDELYNEWYATNAASGETSHKAAFLAGLQIGGEMEREECAKIIEYASNVDEVITFCELAAAIRSREGKK